MLPEPVGPPAAGDSPGPTGVGESDQVDRRVPRRERGMFMVDPRVFPAPGRWKENAACAEVNPDLFFPEKEDGQGCGPARAVCAGCDVRDRCLAYALATGMRVGVWGGLSTAERDDLLPQGRA